jgi:D-sedoheptulose 7-phosphate isomerase
MIDALLYIDNYLAQTKLIVDKIDRGSIEKIIDILAKVKQIGGRLFILGVGGSAGNASHAVNDFRKIAGIESYAPTDNVSELTARINDDGWDSSLVNWLLVSKINAQDCIFILSVGGGNAEKNISNNLVQSLKCAKEIGTKIIGIVGRDGGYTAKVADACVIIPTIDPATVTQHAESFQAVIWHLLVTHPLIKNSETKWESVEKQ